jgi:hypothetical protein
MYRITAACTSSRQNNLQGCRQARSDGGADSVCSVQPEKFNLSLGNVTMWILTVISLKPEEASNQENQLSTRLYMYQAANHVRGHASITYVKPHRYDRDYCITSTAHGPANPR